MSCVRLLLLEGKGTFLELFSSNPWKYDADTISSLVLDSVWEIEVDTDAEFKFFETNNNFIRLTSSNGLGCE